MRRIISFFKRHKKETIFLITGILLTLVGDFVLSRINNNQTNKSNMLNIGVDIFRDKDTSLLKYLKQEVEHGFVSDKKTEAKEFLGRLEVAIKQPKHAILLIGHVHEMGSNKMVEDALVTVARGKTIDTDFTDKNGLFYLIVPYVTDEEADMTELSVTKKGFIPNSFSLNPKNEFKINAKYSIQLTKKN